MKLKIYEMNDCDWVCAESEEGAIKVYDEHLGPGEEAKEHIQVGCPSLLGPTALDTLMFRDDGELSNLPGTRTFFAELSMRKEPGFFASTEY